MAGPLSQPSCRAVSASHPQVSNRIYAATDLPTHPTPPPSPHLLAQLHLVNGVQTPRFLTPSPDRWHLKICAFWKKKKITASTLPRNEESLPHVFCCPHPALLVVVQTGCLGPAAFLKGRTDRRHWGPAPNRPLPPPGSARPEKE